MRPTLTLLLSVATLSTAAALSAQAPIERAANPQPVPGVFVRTGHNTYVHTIASDADHTELRVERGVANIRVDHPEEGSQILVDLPGGQVALVKDGFYTFNADTNTFRVMDGEAAAFSTANSDKEIKVKSAQAVVFGANPHAEDFDRSRSQADLIPGGGQYASREYGSDGYGAEGYGAGGGYIGEAAPYGFYGGYPYYGYGYPYGYGYGWGYPYGWGLGLGFYGGYRGGYYGYRGGFGGWRGGYGGRGGFGGHGGFGGGHGGGGHR